MMRAARFDVSWQVITGRRLIVEIVPPRILRIAAGILAAAGGVALLLSVASIMADVPSLPQIYGSAPGRPARALGIVLGGLVGNLGLCVATHAHTVIVDRDKGTVDHIHLLGFFQRKAIHRLGAFERVLVEWSRSQRSGTVAARSLEVTMRAPGRILLVATIPAARSDRAHGLAAALAAVSGLRFEGVAEADSRAETGRRGPGR